jgi:Xaa-Pro aminopeptidase
MKLRTVAVLLLCAPAAFAQAPPPKEPAWDAAFFTSDFPPEEFAVRRAAVYDALGGEALALVQGAAHPDSYVPIRQTNEFYWLSGLETPDSYLLLDARNRRATVYLPHRKARRESSEGRLLSAEDVDEVRNRTGLERVAPLEQLPEDLAALGRGGDDLALFTPLLPAERASMSRDLALRFLGDAAADPLGRTTSREGLLVAELRERFPWLVVKNLTPVLDRLRLVKSPRELALIRRATRLSELAILEAMRSTQPGVLEHELDAVARFVFRRHGARGEAYYSLVAAGANATIPHYHAGRSVLKAGDLVLMDVAPEVGSYVTDITRQWPVDGRFSGVQRELYGFYLACYRAILAEIKPGLTTAAIMEASAKTMDDILGRTRFSKPIYDTAARAFVAGWRAASPYIGHWVGMAAHDVGGRDRGPLRPGMVFTIEPALRVPEENLYIRLEDLIIVGEKEAEVVSAGLPADMDAIERIIAEPGLLQHVPRDAPGAGLR